MWKAIIIGIAVVIAGLVFSASKEKVSGEYPQDYYRDPLGIPLSVSGTFGELRSNHFHAGLDLRTHNQVGYRVYAAAEGWVSRIKVSAYGYGKALYIQHPNGHTTVYAHLSRFYPPIDRWVKDYQYKHQTFDFDMNLKKGVLPVEQGDTIALSGNSGGSQAPHLHFEIRDANQRPMNPLLFGIEIFDTTSPELQSVMVFDVDRPDQSKRYHVKRHGKSLRVNDDTIRVPYNKVSFGLKAYDYLDNTANKNGLYRVTAYKNNAPIYQFRTHKIGFDETRYLNSHIDYALKKKGLGTYQKTYIQPGNNLSGYEMMASRGEINLNEFPDGVSVKIEGADFKGNTKAVQFFLMHQAEKAYPPPRPQVEKVFPRKLRNTFLNESVFVDFPANTFYDSLHFEYRKTESKASDHYSDIHRIHHPFEPVHKSFKVFIKPKGLPDRLKPKAVIAYRDQNNRVSSKGGKWEDEYLMAKSKALGEYFISVDTVPPKISPFNFFDGKSVKYMDLIKLKVSDSFSGLSFYQGKLDGNWILMEYDAKNNMLYYLFDENMTPGEHQFELVVSDDRNNTSTFKAKLKY